MNPRTRFIVDLYKRVKEAVALAAEIDDADKALEYHVRVYKAKPTDASWKYTKEHEADKAKKAEFDREFEAKREEIERKKADAKATEDAEKERLDREWNEKKKTDAAKVVVALKEKRRLGQKLTQGETEQLEEALAEEELQTQREAQAEAGGSGGVSEEKVMATFNDEFLRSM